MNKPSLFIKLINQLQCSPAENSGVVLEWIKRNESITFFSWKMFKIDNPVFGATEADKFIDKEKTFIETLIELKIRFSYVKLIPDELPQIFFGRDMSNQARRFSNQVKRYFQKIYPVTKIIRITQILNQNLSLKKTYDSILRQSIKSSIDPEKFQKEVNIRQDRGIALKAFGLFAAETAVILEYFQNPVLLAGERSIDTYKYEFFKYPKGRPVLPKLFVI